MDKRRAALRGPIGRELHRGDTQWIERDDWVQIITPSAPGTFLNEIVFSRVTPEDADRVIEAQVAAHHARHKPVKWCVGWWTEPADFADRLRRHGFRSEPVRAMGCDSSHVVAIRESGARVRAVAIDRDNLDEYLAVEAKGWGLPPEQIPLQRCTHLAAIEAPARTAYFFAAVHEDQMVGTAGVFLRDGYGYLTGSQILEHARGKGIYRALVAGRLALLRSLGLPYAVTHARDKTSAPMLEHLGFETIYPYEVFYSPEPEPS